MTGSLRSSHKVLGKVVLGVVGLALAVAVARFTVRQYSEGGMFDPGEWKAQAASDDARQRMVDDLLTRYQLVGMKKAQVIQLLGIPDRKNRLTDDDFSYRLGPERGFMAIDSEWLVLQFSDGRVSKLIFNTD